LGLTVARLDREMSSQEFTDWVAYYRKLDRMKSGKQDDGEGHERGDDHTEDG
jgi:hypothetical protein